MSAKGTFVEDKMREFKGERAHFSFNKCPSYTHDGANAKIRTISHETDYSVGWYSALYVQFISIITRSDN